ncbi:MAG: hypothetical protein ACK58T_43045, partial [Phycisphaerae bacterium]
MPRNRGDAAVGAPADRAEPIRPARGGRRPGLDPQPPTCNRDCTGRRRGGRMVVRALAGPMPREVRPAAAARTAGPAAAVRSPSRLPAVSVPGRHDARRRTQQDLRMEPSKTTRMARRLYLEFVDLPAAARAAALDRACAGDAALRALVESLLAADRAALHGDAPAPRPEAVAAPAPGPAPAVAAAGATVAAERPGMQIGNYKLLEQLGEGGMGTIWLAEQREPVRRRVALKIIKLGMDTKQVIARF